MFGFMTWVQGIAPCEIIGQPSVFSKAATSSSSVSTAVSSSAPKPRNGILPSHCISV
jgi:hypothetical protein